MTGMPAKKTSRKVAPTLGTMRARLESLLYDQQVSVADYRSKIKIIGESILSSSRTMRDVNFRATTAADLRRMAELYDELFFERSCLALAKHYGLSFRWSSRMTRAGGKTTRFVTRVGRLLPAQTRYEIALSSSLIFQTFHDETEPVRVCGCLCENRLQAMQRVVEHESIHLAEMLVWTDSDCAAGRFQSIARRFFGHTEHRHELVTQRERAQKLYDIRLGSRVSFVFEGRQIIGIVNRITRRATVLVESSRGVLYSDGKRYEKFYVPIINLKPAT